MASKTLYDILEVSSSASIDSIRASYERLSVIFSESSPNPEEKLRANAVTQAFLTLGDPVKRAQYDKSLTLRSQPIVQNVEVIEPFWTMPKLIVLAVIVIFGGAYYYKYKKTEARLEAEKVIAAAKAKEAEEKAKAEAEQARFELAKQREEAMQEERLRRERDMAIRQFNSEQRTNQAQNNRTQQQERMTQTQRQREEAQAAADARRRLAQDKAELCRLERERYGRAISC